MSWLHSIASDLYAGDEKLKWFLSSVVHKNTSIFGAQEVNLKRNMP